MKEGQSINTKLFAIVIFLIVGLSTMFMGYNKKSNVSNYNLEDKKVTVIDLSDKRTDFNIPFVLGIIFTSIAVLLTAQIYLANPQPKLDLKDKLTDQEKNVVSFIEQGKTNKEIAIELSISPSTVKTHINNIYKKLEVNSRKELLKNC